MDMSKLSERELLILLNERQNNMNSKLDEVSRSHYTLRDEVHFIKTKNKTLSAVWGVITVVITIFINSLKIFK
ncbi:hypothetical protein JCM21142_104333 [Saccharicrinis fermentans DSM 9555 = JCM 21142]|uniref:Uncharacterized protein n=1 Tax=Saccharicrinis fermentans DSM 9555 = JCM 21142 TaxID=869213 RepID=W7YDP3_9BACT|nr:hypothetical protein JCM21142_104333 [Saccharicrinis fermentans DSM 9555 = JCM 21142]